MTKAMVTVITAAKSWLGEITALRERRQLGKLIMEFHYPEVEVTALGISGQFALNATEKKVR